MSQTQTLPATETDEIDVLAEDVAPSRSAAVDVLTERLTLQRAGSSREIGSWLDGLMPVNGVREARR